jgi:hypothetical protein
MTQKKDLKQQTSSGTKSHVKKRRQSIEELKQPQHSLGENEKNIQKQHEENLQEQDEANVVRPGMTRVASGELGDQVDWEPGFEALGEVRHILANFEELGEEESIDWDTIIGNHHYFDGIRYDFPPLYNEADFEQAFGEFLAIVLDPVNEMPGMSFNRLYLYVDTDKRELVVQEFTRFLEHLKGLKVLQDAGIV